MEGGVYFPAIAYKFDWIGDINYYLTHSWLLSTHYLISALAGFSLLSPHYPTPPFPLPFLQEQKQQTPFLSCGGNGFLPWRQRLLYPSQIGIVGPADKIFLVFFISCLHTRWKNLWSLIKMVLGCTVVFIFFNCFVLYGILL